MPAIAEIARKYEDQGVVLYAINIREQDDKVETFLEEQGLDIRVAMDREGEVAKQYNANAIPQTVLIWKEGNVQVVHVGALADLKERLDDEVAALIAGEDLAAKVVQSEAQKEAVEESGAWTPPENPDPHQILREARSDGSAGRYKTALAKHVWYHHNALKYQRSQAGVRLSFALSYWKRLADDYPPALEKLVEIRDQALKDVQEGRSIRSAFQDMAAINRTIGEGQSTVDAFVALDQRDPNLAKQVFGSADRALIKAKKYELFGKYIEPKTALRRHIDLYRLTRRSAENDDLPLAGRRLEMTNQRFAIDVATLVAILVINERRDEAREVAAEAKKEWNEPDFHTAIDEALDGHVPNAQR